MSKPFSWTCPYCDRHATITNSNFSTKSHSFKHKNGFSLLNSTIITCPNDECAEYSISAQLFEGEIVHGGISPSGAPLLDWKLKPTSKTKQFPSYVPEAILQDYKEASLIRDLSPKASATISRRCLQGIIRDFFNVSGKSLYHEIQEIKDMVDPLTWKAIDSVRGIGNIGAHMERDINNIIDVEPEEAQLLTGLIEILLKDLYVARYEKQRHLEQIIEIAQGKREQKKTPR